MERSIRFRLLICAVATLLFCNCGGVDQVEQPAPPTRAEVTLTTIGHLQSGPTGTTMIGTIELMLILPDGATVQAQPDPANNSILIAGSDVVVPTGVAAGTNTLVLATYTAATVGTPGSVAVHLLNPNGFATGNFVKVNCDITPGTSPTQSNTVVSNFAPGDLDGFSIPTGASGLNVAISSITLK